MDFKLWGTRFTVSFGFFAVVALYVLFDRAGVGLPAIAAVALHEGGHILAMQLAGAKISAMKFYPFGVCLEKRGLLPYGREAVVYLGGVAANAISAAVCVPIWGWNLFAQVSMGLILFNLLPIGRLDGGQLLRLMLQRANRLDRADRLQKVIGFVLLTPLFAASFLMVAQGNYTLLFTAAYLAVFLLRGT